MNKDLHDKLAGWHSQIQKVQEAEDTYLQLEAYEKTLFGKLFLEATGKNVTEREAQAYTSQAWIDFKKGLAVAQAAYHKARNLLELRQASFQSTYLSVKTSSEAIQKYPRGET